MQHRRIFKWLVLTVILASMLGLYTSRRRAGDAASLTKSCNDLNDDAFTLLGFANASSRSENPSPVLSSIASFASDSTALTRALEAKNSTRAADLVARLETDRAAVNSAMAAHPDVLPTKEWAAAQRQLEAIVKWIPPVPAHPAEASQSTEEPPRSENVQTTPPTSSPEGVNASVEQESFQDYTVRIFKDMDTPYIKSGIPALDSPETPYFEILRYDKVIYRQKLAEDEGHFAIDARFLKARIDVAALNTLDFEDAPTGVVKMGMDVTGNGQPDLVVDEWTGGAYCCTVLHIFEIGRRFRRIGTIDVGEFETGEFPLFLHLDRGSDYQIQLDDKTFLFWRDTDHMGSPAPEVILRYQGGHYRVAPNLMRRPAPTMAQLAAWARKERYPQLRRRHYHHMPGESSPSESDDRAGMGKYPGSRVWGRMLDLVYTGHAKLAWKFLDMVWAPGRPGKRKFLNAFRAQLSKSPYWPAIRTMNSL